MTPAGIEQGPAKLPGQSEGTAARLSSPELARLIRHGYQLFGAGRITDALRLASQASMVETHDASLADSMGTLLTILGQPESGLSCFEQAVALAPNHTGFRYNLAMAERMCGHLERAEANLDEVIRNRPSDGEAYYARSDLRTQTLTRNHITELERVLPSLRVQRAGLALAFALAKELEDIGQHARSFECLHTACRAHRASLQYDVATDVAVLEKLIRTHRRDALQARHTRLCSRAPIFVLGLPRSGTTLVERILTGHSEIRAAGEIDTFQRLAVAAVEARWGKAVRKLEFVDRLLELDLEKLGVDYLSEAHVRAGTQGRFIDKLPANYLYAGAIHAALPHARFVALRRHPMDSCYAMYKTLFASAYPFTYDLGDLGRYYLAWDRLIRHWEENLGSAWLTVSYEALVTTPEAVGRRILAHCGLDWEEQCLQTQERQEPVMTASAVQIRAPIHSRSVGQWRHHAERLMPLYEFFHAHGLEV